MTNEELQKIMNGSPISDEDIERIWVDMKACDTRRFNALPEAERKRLEKEFIDPSFDRFSEDPLGGDDEDVSD